MDKVMKAGQPGSFGGTETGHGWGAEALGGQQEPRPYF
jgi:hypothetical protein